MKPLLGLLTTAVFLALTAACAGPETRPLGPSPQVPTDVQFGLYHQEFNQPGDGE